MSLKEKGKVSLKHKISKVTSKIEALGSKVKFGVNMGFNSRYRTQWLEGELASDLSRGVISDEQYNNILSQSQDPKTSRHLAESFAVPIASYVVTAPIVGSVAVYAYLTGDPVAWGYTASHFFTQQIPKVSISSVVRAGALASSVIYDRVRERDLGTKQKNTAELSAVGLSALSWMGIGNAGPFLRMVAGTSPDLGMYMAGKTLKGRAMRMVENAAQKLSS